jgi:hypothetical protein
MFVVLHPYWRSRRFRSILVLSPQPAADLAAALYLATGRIGTIRTPYGTASDRWP